MRVLPILLLWLLMATPTLFAEQNTGIQTIEIQGVSRVGEGTSGEWAAMIPGAATVLNTQAYRPVAPRPTGGELPSEWERRIEYRWNFNDGSGVLSSGDIANITHRFKDDGTYTLTVEARTSDRVIARGEKVIEVRNRPPSNLRLRAVYMGPEAGRYLLTATADDAPGDALQFDWDFGDGNTASDVGWEVYHTFPAGIFTVSVTAVDNDGKQATETIELSVNSYSESVLEDTDASRAESLQPGVELELAVSGDLRANFKGIVKPFYGLHLAAVEDDKVCRFLFTAWDSANLMNAMAIFDLRGMRENGASYTLRAPQVNVNFFKDAEGYNNYREILKNDPAAAVSGMLALAGALTGNQSVQEKTGLAPGGPGPGVPPAKVAISPFKVSETEGFQTVGGEVELEFTPFRSATGDIRLRLANTSARSSLREISIDGAFALDLARLQQNGIMLYNQCGAGGFEITKVNPDDNPKHVVRPRPTARAVFSSPVDPNTVTDQTFQLTYPDAADASPHPVEVQIQRSEHGALLKPKEPLFGGVRYTVRIKTGEDGVRSRAGMALEDADSSGWYTWGFTTAVNLEPRNTAGDEILGCAVYQSVRNAPLIIGKPAVSRIYALWKKNPLVHHSAQVKDFKANVELRQGRDIIASRVHTFVRPDLWQQRGIDTSKAAQSANVFWTPGDTTHKRVRVVLNVEKTPVSSYSPSYWGVCSTPLWQHSPKLNVALFLLAVNAYEDKATRERVSSTMWSIMRDATTYIKQQFPLKDVNVEFGGVIEHPLKRRMLNPNTDCDTNCALNTLYTYSGEKSDADIILGIVPLAAPIVGGEAGQRISPEEPAYIVLGIDEEAAHYDRFVYAVAHEIGHALWLDHLPFVSEEDQAVRGYLAGLRDRALANDFSPVHWHQGIDGFRIAEDGLSGWNKNSTEGNAEGRWLTPLMFPTTIPYKNAFIVRHQYLHMQRELEKRNGKPRGVAIKLQ